MSELQTDWVGPAEALMRTQRDDYYVLDLTLPDEKRRNIRYGFLLGSIGMLIPEQTLCEVMKEATIYPIPNTQKWMKGLINLRGNLIPVYDMALLLGLSQKSSRNDIVLIVGRGADSLALVSDMLPKSYEISDWKQLSHTPRLAASLSDYVGEVYAAGDVIWIGIDYRSYFMFLKNRIAA